MHAIARAKERYGLDLTVEDLRRLEKQCQNKSTVLASGNGRRVQLVEHAGIAMKAVVSVESGLIVTLLGKDQNVWDKKKPGKMRRRKNVKRYVASKGTKQ